MTCGDGVGNSACSAKPLSQVLVVQAVEPNIVNRSRCCCCRGHLELHDPKEVQYRCSEPPPSITKESWVSVALVLRFNQKMYLPNRLPKAT